MHDASVDVREVVLARLRAQNAPGAEGASGETAASTWRDCFLPDDKQQLARQVGISLAPPEFKLSLEAAQIGSANFRSVGTPCPGFDAFEKDVQARHKKPAARQP